MTNTELMTAEDIALELLNTNAPIEDAAIEPDLKSNPYIGIAAAPFSPEAAEVLMREIPDSDVEIRPDGLIYLPEIKYRRILNRAFGPGAWSLLPMDITVASADNMLYYRGALFVHGRFVSEAIGEQQYYPTNDRMSYATAAEAAKSNCLMRCCKDLGIASELWDPTFVRRWIGEYAQEVWCTNIGSGGGDRGKKRKMWRKKSAPKIDVYPWREEAYDGGMGESVDEVRERQNASSGHNGVTSGHKDSGFKPATPPASTTHHITFRQVKRFQAIAGDRGWTPEETEALLKAYKFETPDQILRSSYDSICTDLEDAGKLQDIRRHKAA